MLLDYLLVRYIFYLAVFILVPSLAGGKSSFEKYFIQTQDMKFRIRGNVLYTFQFVS